MFATESGEYRVYEFGPDDVDQHPFTGPRAFTRACARFDRLKTDPDVWQVWLARSDGGAWQLIAAELRREPGAAWQPINLPTAATVG